MRSLKDYPTESSIYGNSILDSVGPGTHRPSKFCFWSPFKSRRGAALDRTIVALEASALALIGCAIATGVGGLLR
jgi:hypothetical protein